MMAELGEYSGSADQPNVERRMEEQWCCRQARPRLKMICTRTAAGIGRTPCERRFLGLALARSILSGDVAELIARCKRRWRMC